MRYFLLFIVAIVILSAVGFLTNAAGLWGSTYVERKVFETSYQRHEGIEAEIATFEAQLAEIEAQLENTELDVDTRSNLEAQARSLRVRIEAAKRRL